MSVEENKAMVREGIEKIWNGGDWAAAEESYAPDLVVHFPAFPEPIQGRDEFGKLHATMHTAFPDYNVTIDDLLGDGDRVSARWTLRATHRGEFFGMPGTGNRVTVEEFAILRVADGKVKEIWLMPDLMGQLQQLGMLPAGPPPKAMILALRIGKRLGGLLPGRRRREPS